MDRYFDAAASALATGASRREALLLLGKGAIAALLSLAGFEREVWAQSCVRQCQQACTSPLGVLDFACLRACATTQVECVACDVTTGGCHPCEDPCRAQTERLAVARSPGFAPIDAILRAEGFSSSSSSTLVIGEVGGASVGATLVKSFAHVPNSDLTAHIVSLPETGLSVGTIFEGQRLDRAITLSESNSLEIISPPFEFGAGFLGSPVPDPLCNASCEAACGGAADKVGCIAVFSRICARAGRGAAACEAIAAMVCFVGSEAACNSLCDLIVKSACGPSPCPPNTAICPVGSGCCGQCESCVISPFGEASCSPPVFNCGNTCCPAGTCCGNTCCPAGTCCGDTCCEKGSCCAGTCCQSSCCGDQCCGAGDTCVNGQCVSPCPPCTRPTADGLGCEPVTCGRCEECVTVPDPIAGYVEVCRSMCSSGDTCCCRGYRCPCPTGPNAHRVFNSCNECRIVCPGNTGCFAYAYCEPVGDPRCPACP